MKRMLLIILILFTGSAEADDWGIVSDHKELINYKIIDVGEISELTPPPNTKWVSKVFKMNNYYFNILGSTSATYGYRKPALLLENDQGINSIAIFEVYVSSIRVIVEPIIMYKTKIGTNGISIDYGSDEYLEQLKKHNEELEKKLKELKKEFP